MSGSVIKPKGIIYVDLWAAFYTFVAVISFLPPILENIIADIPIADNLLNIVRLFLCLMMILHSLMRKTMRLTAMEIALLTFAIWGFLVTLAHEPEHLFWYSGSVGFKIVTMIFLVNNMENGEALKCIRGIARYFTGLIWLNAMFMVMYPHGIFMSSTGAIVERSNWIFGSKNNVVMYAIIVICVLYLDNLLYKKVFNYITFIIFTVEIACMGPRGIEIMRGSTTALFMLAFFSIAVLLRNIPVFKLFENAITVLGIALLSVFLCILIWYISLKETGILNEALNDILKIFGKDTTFSNRDIIWRIVSLSIAQHPFVGHGFQQMQFQIRTNMRVASMYSFWGSVTFYYGLIGSLILFVALYLSEKNTVGGSDASNEHRFVFKLGIAMFLVCGLMNEIYTWYCLIFLMEMYNHSETLYLQMENDLAESL